MTPKYAPSHSRAPSCEPRQPCDKMYGESVRVGVDVSGLQSSRALSLTAPLDTLGQGYSPHSEQGAGMITSSRASSWIFGVKGAKSVQNENNFH